MLFSDLEYSPDMFSVAMTYCYHGHENSKQILKQLMNYIYTSHTFATIKQLYCQFQSHYNSFMIIQINGL